jgi:DsbC/DsbD-like thiol-disulfide interchange protein
MRLYSSLLKLPSLLCLIAVATAGSAYALSEFEQRVKASVSGPAQAAAGKAFDLLVSVEVQEGYHIQANNAKEPYIPTSVLVTAPAGYKLGTPSFPESKTGEFFGEKLKVFEGKITVKVPVTPPAGGKGKQEFSVKVGYQACNQSTCDPPNSATASAEVTITPGAATGPAKKPTPKKVKHP